MTRKKKLVFLGSVALIVLTLASLAGATFVFAQEFPLPIPFGGHGGMGGFGGRGMGRSGGHGSEGFAWAGGGEWTMIDTAAEVLGLTPEDLTAELRAGKTLEEIAEEQGVEIEAVQDAISAARSEAMQDAIEQAVEDGSMSQEQADWLLAGLEQGLVPMGQSFGSGRGRRGNPDGECSCGLH